MRYIIGIPAAMLMTLAFACFVTSLGLIAVSSDQTLFGQPNIIEAGLALAISTMSGMLAQRCGVLVGDSFMWDD